MRAAMYIFINEGLDMSAGKIAAQAAHAAVEAYRLSFVPGEDSPPDEHKEKLMRSWYTGGHYAKYIMSARDADHLCWIERYLEDRGFETVMIIDEGRTEIEPIQPTAVGVALVDKDDEHTAATFSSFKTLKSPRPNQPKRPSLRHRINKSALPIAFTRYWRPYLTSKP